jgi:hypothetical protein
MPPVGFMFGRRPDEIDGAQFPHRRASVPLSVPQFAIGLYLKRATRQSYTQRHLQLPSSAGSLDGFPYGRVNSNLADLYSGLWMGGLKRRAATRQENNSRSARRVRRATFRAVAVRHVS